MGRLTTQLSSSDTITVIDNRTSKTIEIPITENSIPATAFKQLSIPGVSSKGREEDEESKGLRVFDPGYMNTAVIKSTITFIDGEAGILRYRGYPIEQLAEHSTFLESSYLLLYGNLPSPSQKILFEKEVQAHSYVHSDLEGFMKSFRYDAHPMAILVSAFSALGSFHSEANPSLQGQKLFTTGTPDSLRNMDKQIYRLIGKAPTLAAMAYRIRQGRPFNRPPVGLGYTESFLYQLDFLNEREYRPSPVLAKALDVLFLLHADHEVNCSTASILQVGSSGVDPYSGVAAACAALYGPLHGGANEAVIRMLLDIGSPENVPEFIEKVKSKQKVLSGFGHRVYRTSDPRSFVIRKIAEEVFEATGRDQLLEVAMALHDAALKDDYFKSRKLYPNVDFWSGLIYRAMGFPFDFFPVLFAVPRVVGWLAHWRQMMLAQGGLKIWRPRQIYVGPTLRDYVRLEDRAEESGQKHVNQASATFGLRLIESYQKDKPDQPRQVSVIPLLIFDLTIVLTHYRMSPSVTSISNNTTATPSSSLSKYTSTSPASSSSSKSSSSSLNSMTTVTTTSFDGFLDGNISDVGILLKTLSFSSQKHSFQRRKDPAQSPYINHPIGVANFIAETGETDIVVLQAAILHDVVEDTECTIDEIELHFGPEVAKVVDECSDDTTLSACARKLAQVETAGHKSKRAQQVKLGDKLHNCLSIQSAIPVGWDVERSQRYFIWSKQVVDLCASSNPKLAARLYTLFSEGTFVHRGKTYACVPRKMSDISGTKWKSYYPPVDY
ncbi:peroxysomal citrate synthase [Phaffia rhodozyma]|uniref:Citrate synthase n=1 Tax=Phaffia rhodozyma TaxID=264483 RepID=A0A0F7SS85_PHARH|nr:peroxysomal citrate synthase [Phaffia rhodozyma]